MSLLKYAFGGAVGNVIYDSGKNFIIEKRKEEATIDFPEWLNKGTFSDIVQSVCDTYSRIKKLSLKGTFIEIEVQSDMTMKNWNFYLDYNDNGNITGKYWLFSDRINSKLSKSVAEKIRNKILEKYNLYFYGK